MSDMSDPGAGYQPEVSHMKAARQGKLTRLVVRISLETVKAETDPEIKKQIDVIATAISQPLLPEDINLTLKRLVASDASMESRAASAKWASGPTDCRSGRHDLDAIMTLHPEKGLLATIKEQPEWKEYEAFNQLDMLVGKLNVEATKIEFANQAIASANSTLATLTLLKRSYS